MSRQSNSDGLDPSPSSQRTQQSHAMGYSSEAGYTEISDETTPSFDDVFLHTNLDSIPDIEPEDEVGTSALHAGDGQPMNHLVAQPVLAAGMDRSAPSTSGELPHTKFPITPSHPLSPVHTDTQSPLPVNPINDSSHLAVETATVSHGKDAVQAQHREQVGPNFTTPSFQQTPALTGSSRNSSNVSIGPVQPESGPTVASPIVKIENYSRDESPWDRVPDEAMPEQDEWPQQSSHLSPDAAEIAWVREIQESDPSYVSPAKSSTHTARLDEGTYFPPAASGRVGVDPHQRAQINSVEVPSLKDQEANRKLEERNADVEDWLVCSATPSLASSRRQRAKSMGDAGHIGQRISRPVAGVPAPNHPAIPGPGVLVDEDTDGELEGEERSSIEHSRSDSASTVSIWSGHPDSGLWDGDDPTMNQAAEPPQDDVSRPWADSSLPGDITDAQTQPPSSDAAIMRFQQLADNLETASRVATWGTRRLSETDIAKFLDDVEPLKSFSIGDDHAKGKMKADRKGSFFDMEGVKRFLPRRSGSNLRRKHSDKSPSDENVEQPERSRKESLSNFVHGRGSSTSKKPKQLKTDTSSAVAAMATQIAALGGSGSHNARAATTPSSTWRHPMKRNRSRSDLSRIRGSEDLGKSGLSGLIAQHGGPPMPLLASPTLDKGEANPYALGASPAHQDQDDVMEEQGIKMEFRSSKSPIEPTLQGFQVHAKQLNPRLVPFLVDRISHEQVRRFKKLVDAKSKHVRAVQERDCSSGSFCTALGGGPLLLQPKANNRDAEVSHSSFQITATSNSDDESYAPGESAVAAAQFPPGVPLPPVKRLPAEFECQLCFKIKKFQKPSDWTKHVHEDVQPFTCTFANCAEPKSFKRKADWVRHENERHRQLEWWTCNLPDCSHTCYRKDNFVQHLVREHKMTEPKSKASRTTMAPSAAFGDRTDPSSAELTMGRDALGHSSPQGSPGDTEGLWSLVETCHHETLKSSREEPCKFCGNVCGSWKKLTVHLARHMELISLPILVLVDQRAPGAASLTGPIEQKMEQTTRTSMASPNGLKLESLDTPPNLLSTRLPGDDLHTAYDIQPVDNYCMPDTGGDGFPRYDAQQSLHVQTPNAQSHPQSLYSGFQNTPNGGAVVSPFGGSRQHHYYPISNPGDATSDAGQTFYGRTSVCGHEQRLAAGISPSDGSAMASSVGQRHISPLEHQSYNVGRPDVGQNLQSGETFEHAGNGTTYENLATRGYAQPQGYSYQGQ